MKSIKILIFLFLIPFVAFSQKSQLGVTAGLAGYQGDLTHAYSLKGAGFAGGLVYKNAFSDKLSLRAGVTVGNFNGDDEFFPEDSGDRKFSFKTNFVDASVGLEYAFLGKPRYDETGVFQKNFSPFVNIGLGFVNASPEVTAAGVGVVKSEDLEPSTGHFLIPIGAGLKYDLSEKLTVGAEFSIRAPFSDYLDGISESANPDKNDWYYVAGVTASYHFGKRTSGDGLTE